jgi:hypothetical protein
MMQSMVVDRREGLRFAGCVAYGFLVFGVFFRLTSEVLPVLGVLVAGSAVIGFLLGRRPWLWGIAIGLGTRLPFSEPPLSQEHIAHERPSHPLPLPWGLTGNPIAEVVAGSLLIMAFPFVGVMVGWVVRKLASCVPDLVRPRAL